MSPKSERKEDQLIVGVRCPYYTGRNFTEIRIDSGQYTSLSLVELINSRIYSTLGNSFSSSLCRLWVNPVSGKIEFFVDGENKDEEKKVSLLIFASIKVTKQVFHFTLIIHLSL